MLDNLRSVPWPLAMALFLGGATVSAIALTLIIGNGGGSAAATRRPLPRDLRRGAETAPGRRVAPRREAESPSGEEQQRVSLPRMVGQRFIVGLSGEPREALLSDVRHGEIGGVVLFPEGASPAATAAAAAKLQRAAIGGHNPQLLIATDQEGGQVKRFASGPPQEPLSRLTEAGALREGEKTGSFLREAGVNVDLAPVLDLELPHSFMTAQGRTISANPNRVARIAGAFAQGLGQTNVMAVAKHFPGLGGATVDTDEGQSLVAEGLSRAVLPFKRLIEREPRAAVMLSTAIYTTLDPLRGAAWSPSVVNGLLREKLGFEGLTISDDLASPGVAASVSPVGKAVTESAEAGVDMVMVVDPELFRPAHEALLAAAEAGRISRSELLASYNRILDAKRGLPR